MGQLFIGVLMWTIVMIMPSLISYFKTVNPTISLVLLTTVYPTILAYLSRSGSFWVSYPVIMISSVAALIISLALVYIFKTKNEIILTTVPITTFALTMVLLSTNFMNMYNNAVVSP
jgi:hypothetical protein